MAHFAEIDSNNKVLRVVVACNQDIANNGGEQSEQAAKHFETVCPLSDNGVKWVQTSYNHNFRKTFAGYGMTYDAVKDKFLEKQPFPSWSLNDNDDWVAPVAYPSIISEDIPDVGEVRFIEINWDENNQKWTGIKLRPSDGALLDIEWDSSTSSWSLI
jgi:hypothetical protein